MISAIVAVNNNWGIGYNGNLLERIPEDLNYFKNFVTNKLLIVGRKTYDTLPRRAFSQRDMVVITTNWQMYTDNHLVCIPNTNTFYMDLNQCIDFLKNKVYRDNNGINKDICIIGGEQIYKELLPFCDRVYVTKIYKDHENVDTYFPNLDESDEWTPAFNSDLRTFNDLSYQFWEYDRIS